MDQMEFWVESSGDVERARDGEKEQRVAACASLGTASLGPPPPIMDV